MTSGSPAPYELMARLAIGESPWWHGMRAVYGLPTGGTLDNAGFVYFSDLDGNRWPSR